MRAIVLCGVPLVFIAQLFLDYNSIIRNVLSLIIFVSFILWVLAVADAAKNVKCPNCKKKLGYLVLDPNYSKTFSPIWFPRDIPERIKQCPYCQADFSHEVAEQSTPPKHCSP